MKTVNIKGKEYVEVSERIKYFRGEDAFAGFSLLSEIVEVTDKRVLMRAWIENEKGETVATGHAYETSDSSFINKTSYIENCETSAWGRALANFGIGIDAGVASAHEVANAVNNQSPAGTAKVQSYAESKQDDDKEWLNDITELVSWAKERMMSGDDAVKKAREKYKVSNKTADEIRSALNA